MNTSKSNAVLALFAMMLVFGVLSPLHGEGTTTGADSVVVLKQDTTRIVTTPGATIRIQVRGNSGTGYEWSISQIDARCLRILSTITKSDPGMPGAAKFTIYSMEPLIEGTSVLKFTYKRSWEKMPALTYKVIVETR